MRDIDWPLWVMSAIIIFLICLCFFAVFAMGANQKQFMKECQQDHKHYECEALYRAGDSNTVYMPIIIPSGR